MKNISTKLNLIMLGLALSVPSSFTFAEDAGKFYINPAIGYQFFGSDRNLDDALTLSLGGEYVLTPKFGVEASYLFANPDAKTGGGDADLDQYTLDALYYAEQYRNWQPFINAGIGHSAFDFNSGSAKETQLNLGIGTRYNFDEQWSARIQAKAINSLDDEVWDQLLTLGISYAFGGGRSMTEIVPAAAAVVIADTDGDGVRDDIDHCPGTQAGMTIDAKGCDLDSDKDGIADNRDNCPNSLTNEKVDADGCKIVVMRSESVKLAINFTNNSADVPTAAMGEIKSVADFMKNYPQAKVIIEGYTDDKGDAGYNKSLSQRRADTVMQSLIENYNIDEERVSAVGYGIENPVADNSTPEGRRENRRVIAQINITVEE